MNAFIKTLKEVAPAPATVIFANSGIYLTTEGSELIEDIRTLEEQGVEILSCGTCLDYYDVYYNHSKEPIVGKASNMYEIVQALISSDRIVKL
jgi:sulfur relay (sulfurtransferase) complex TusBCD TusD component (DsrE family)